MKKSTQRSGPKTPVTVNVAAGRLGISIPFVFRLAAKEIIPCIRIGRAVRFLPSDIDAFLRNCRRPKDECAESSGERKRTGVK